MGYAPPRTAFPQYAAADAAFEDWPMQLATSQAARRPSRSSNGPRPGNAMRIVKPGSTSSSPRSTMPHARRRTLVNDSNLSRKRQHIMDHIPLPAPATGLSPEPTKRSQRPMSWHPGSSHFQTHQHQEQAPPQPQPPQQLANAYHISAHGRWNDQALLPNYQHMSPMPTSYSCQASPVTFSPLSLPSNDIHSQPCYYVDNQGWSLPPQQVPSYVSPPVDSCNISPALESNVDYADSFPSLFPATAMPIPDAEGSQGSASSEWRSFVEHGFDRTFPPTPENLPQMQLKPAVQMESAESAPYEPLSEPEDDSEILVGMGLYDAPEKHEADPGLSNYRSIVSSLLGGPPKLPEAGKGLKLEETWQPPESEDEDEDEEKADAEDAEDAEDA